MIGLQLDVGWVRADGLALAPTAAALFTTPYLDVAFNKNADGSASFGPIDAWSGASSWSSTGTPASTCNDYTSTTGITGVGGRVGDTKTSILRGYCMNIPCAPSYFRLLCMQN